MQPTARQTGHPPGPPSRRPRVAVVRVAAVAVGLLAAAPALQAHPHGALDCALTLAARPANRPGESAQLAFLDLQLTLDEASSQSLMPRLPVAGLPPPSDAPAARQAVLLAQTVAGLFRQSGWMLQLRPGRDDGPTLPDLTDPEPPRYTRGPDGRLQVQVRLQPAADAAPIPLEGLRIACRDPVWYWLAGYPAAPPAGPAGCRAELGPLMHQGQQAQALQTAARQAGTAGADQMPEALGRRNDLRAASLTLHC